MYSCPISFELLGAFRSLVDDYDLINYHHPWPFADMLHLLGKIQKPYLITYHSDIVKQKILNQLYKPIQNIFLHKTNAIVTTSENLKYSSEILKPHLKKTSYIPIGISKELYPSAKHALNSQWQERFKTKFFLFLGVLRYYKGLSILIDAMKNTNLMLVIAGAGPEELKLHAQAKRLNLTNIVFLGRVSEEDKISLLSTCHAVICPSHLRAEAFGINLLEGLMYGKPLISTELGTGTSFVNKHNVSGLVVPPARADLLREAMLKLYNDSALYNRLKQGAAQHFTDTFLAHNMGEHYLQKYKEILRIS